MDNFEKVEKLRERASVSYEEAKAALEASGWDMLDAMVLLEKQGRTQAPKQSNFSTSYEQQEDYLPVRKIVENEKEKKSKGERPLGSLIKSFIRICKENSFCVARKDREIFRVPVSVTILLLIFFWKVMIPISIVGLFLGFRYSFEGKDELKTANKVMNSVGNVAEQIKNELKSVDASGKAEKTEEEAAEAVKKAAEEKTVEEQETTDEVSE